MVLRTDVTHEKAVSAVLDERLEFHEAGLPEVAGHGLLAVMKSIREATTQLSLVEDRLHVIAGYVEPVERPNLVPVAEAWINPRHVLMVYSDDDVPTVLLSNGRNVSFPDGTVAEVVEALSW